MRPDPRKVEVWKALMKVDADTQRAVLQFLKKAVEALNKAVDQRVDAALARVDAKLRTIRDGKDGKNGRDGRNGFDGEDGLPGRDGKDGSPDSPQDILSKLLTIKTPWLTIKDKEALEKLVKESNGKQLTFGAAGGGRGFFVYIDGVKKGIIKELNFVAGSGMAIAYSIVSGRPTLTFNASGASLTVETPTGTVNASNTSFTVSAEPKYVVADGTTYFAGAGYTYAALTITMDVAPSASIRAII